MNGNKIIEEVEFSRCAEDFIYFCETYVKINHPIKGSINFILHPYQKRYIKHIQDNRFSIAKKFRQGGFTTLTEIYFLWLSMFRFDQQIVIISKTNVESKHLLNLIRNIINELPEWLQPSLSKNNKHSIEFEKTNCKILFRNPGATRGLKADYIFLDEPAFWNDAEKCWKEVYPMLSCGGKAVVISTTNGDSKDNWFYKTYTDAENLKNDFRIFHCNYLEHPDYSNEEWVFNTKRNLGAKGWLQEVLCVFVDHSQQKSNIEFFEDISEAEILVESMKKETKSKHTLDKLNAFKLGITASAPPNWALKGKDGLDWSGDHYTDEPKSYNHEQEQEHLHCEVLLGRTSKSRAYQFKNMTYEERKAFLEKYDAPGTIGHAEFDSFNIKDIEGFAEFWTDVAELYSEYENIKNVYFESVKCKNEKMKEIEEEINKNLSKDMLVMAGIADAKDIEDFNCARPDLKIIEKIKSSGRYSNDLILSFCKDRLCINKIPTVIREDDVRDLYNGAFSLIGYEEAINLAVTTITSKLDELFKEENEQLLDEKAFK